MAFRIRWTLKKREEFLKRLAETGNVADACRLIGLSHSRAYELRKEDPDFAERWDDAVEQAVDLMLEEARRRAVEGTDKPVFYRGSICGHLREYSDVLLMFLIKAHRPEYATERRELSGKYGAPLMAVAPPMSDKERERISRIASEILLAEADEAAED